MAKRKKAKEETSPETDAKKKLLIRIHDRFKVMSEADDDNRRLAMADHRFVNVPGEQWDSNMKENRGSRPCYEFNKLRINGKRVINGIRDNRPQGKVTAVENGDAEGAELREGLIRNIESMSDIDTVTDQCAEYQVDAGYAVMRVDVEYCDDSMWDQDIKVHGLKNPFCAYSDPACKDILLRRDAEDWIITERISNKAYEAKYGDAEKISFDEGEFDDEDDWTEENTVRIVEYWYKEPHEKDLHLVEMPNEDGSVDRLTVDSESDEWQVMAAKGVQPIKTRRVKTHKIMMCVASGDSILEGPVRSIGKQFPFVPIYGEIKVVDGKVVWHGLHRFSKDAQRVYNFDRTAAAESAHAASKSQFWATAKQAAGLDKLWARAHKESLPFMIYNHDPAVNGPPQRMAGPELPIAFMSLAEVDAADIRDTSGLHEASFGEESDEKSGIALQRKQAQAGIVTYNFPDNMAKARKRVGEIILDYIPEIYDADREIRVLGADGEADYKRINHVVFDDATGTSIRVNDLTSGKYDYTVITGPSFATQRQEFTAMLIEIATRSPELMQVAGDLFFKATDMPYASEIAKRWQTILPPQIQQQISEGKEIPPEAQAVMAQANQAMEAVQQQTQLIQDAAAEVQQDKMASEKAKSEVKGLISDLEVKQAQFNENVAKQLAALTLKEVGLQQREAQLTGQQEQIDGQQKQVEAKEGEVSTAQKAVEQIDSMVADFMEKAGDVMKKIQSKPRIKHLEIQRAEGQPPRAVPVYDEEATPA